MATQTVNFAQNVVLHSGQTIFGGASGFSVPAGSFDVAIDTTNSNPGIDIVIEIDSTPDGGTTWQEQVAFEFTTDPVTNRQGVPTTVHNIGWQWPGGNLRVVANVTAQCKLSITGTLTT